MDEYCSGSLGFTYVLRVFRTFERDNVERVDVLFKGWLDSQDWISKYKLPAEPLGKGVYSRTDVREGAAEKLGQQFVKCKYSL